MIRKISIRWFLWFTIVAVYAIILGGLLYFNLFKHVFDVELQNQVINLVSENASVLIEGLTTESHYITIPESEVIFSWPRHNSHVTNVTYFNGDGTVRWHKNINLLDMSLQEYYRNNYLDTNAVGEAFQTGVPRVFIKDDGNMYEIAIPLKAKDDKIAGVIDMDVSRKKVKEEITNALIYYITGAVIIFLFMGIVLYIFVIKNVSNPIIQIADSIDNISTKSFQLDYTARNDEIGWLAKSIENFLGKVKTELMEREEVDKIRQHYEQEWWSSILAVTIPKGTRAIVVDENNNIMHTNFEVKIKKDGPVHLLDIFGGRQQEIINLVGQAMDNPGKVFRAKTQSNGRGFGIKALQLSSKGGIIRTVIVLEPK